MQEARALGVHHFAFVRSSLLGLDLAESFERYMAWSETTTDLRFVQNRRDALLKQIIEAVAMQGRKKLECRQDLQGQHLPSPIRHLFVR